MEQLTMFTIRNRQGLVQRTVCHCVTYLLGVHACMALKWDNTYRCELKQGQWCLQYSPTATERPSGEHLPVAVRPGQREIHNQRGWWRRIVMCVGHFVSLPCTFTKTMRALYRLIKTLQRKQKETFEYFMCANFVSSFFFQ